MGLKPSKLPYSSMLHRQRITPNELRQLLNVITNPSEHIDRMYASATWRTGQEGSTTSTTDLMNVEDPESLVQLSIFVWYNDSSDLRFILKPPNPYVSGSSGMALDRSRRVESIYHSFPVRRGWFRFAYVMMAILAFTCAVSIVRIPPLADRYGDDPLLGGVLIPLMLGLILNMLVYLISLRIDPSAKGLITRGIASPWYRDRMAITGILSLAGTAISIAITAYVAFWK